METFEYQGLSIAYVRATSAKAGARDPARQPVILLHNGGMSHASWRDVMPSLALRHDVYALDLLGYGESSKPRGAASYTLERYVEILGAFIEHLRLGPVALVGNCMGAAISLTYAMQRPKDVSSLVLINILTEATFRAGGLGTSLALQRATPTFARPVVAALRRLAIPTMFKKSLVRYQLGRQGRDQHLDEASDLCACYDTPGQMRSLLGVFEDFASYAKLDTFTRPASFPPITMIWGEDNRVLPASAGRELAVRLRPERAAWLERCGHLPMLEAPSEVISILAGALAPRRRHLEVAS